MPPQLSELKFGSLLAYSPRGQSIESQSSKRFGLQLKGNRIVVPDPPRTAAKHLAIALRHLASEGPLVDFFDSEDILVPVPPSGLLQSNSVWPALAIAEALVAEGLGANVDRCLERKSALPKSAYAAPGERPTLAEHRASLGAAPPFFAAKRLLLIDDFVTKGTTLLACAQALAEKEPGTEILAFAAFRTLGLQPEIERLVEPCVGRIWLAHGEVHRNP